MRAILFCEIPIGIGIPNKNVNFVNRQFLGVCAVNSASLLRLDNTLTVSTVPKL